MGKRDTTAKIQLHERHMKREIVIMLLDPK